MDIEVEFEKIPAYNFTVLIKPMDSGRVAFIQNEVTGDCTLTATPLDGYHFLCWYDEDTQSILSTNNPYMFQMTHDQVIDAVFFVTVGIQSSIEHGSLEIVDDKQIYQAGDTVTLLGHPDNGYVVGYYMAGELHDGPAVLERLEGDSFVMPANDMAVSVVFFPDPTIVTITSVADWNAFAAAVNSGTNTYEGKTVTLLTDIDPVTNTVGTAEHPFRGTFDGGGHTLTVVIDSQEQCTALFREIDGATISNLVVAGYISGGNHSAGLVGACGTNAPNTIVDCTVSASVTGAA
jgi:hypothetical protein